MWSVRIYSLWDRLRAVNPQVPKASSCWRFLADTLSKSTCLFCFIKNSSWKLSLTQNKISFLLSATTAKSYYLKWHCLQQSSSMECLNQKIPVNLAEHWDQDSLRPEQWHWNSTAALVEGFSSPHFNCLTSSCTIHWVRHGWVFCRLCQAAFQMN